MSKIGQKNTSPELIVRSLIFRLGYRYRIHRKELPGCPDIVFPGRKKVIFINGCFWHGHDDCSKWRMPKSNSEFWRQKISRNRARDARKQKELAEEGWDSLVIWECQVSDEEKLKKLIVNYLGSAAS